MQNHYNLAYREEEREMLPLLRDLGVACLPFSPLARGFLAKAPEEVASTASAGLRWNADRLRSQYYGSEADRAIAAQVGKVAGMHKCSRAQVACAWLLSRESASGGVTAPIMGASSVEQLEDAVLALDLTLSLAEIKELESRYCPKVVMGHY